MQQIRVRQLLQGIKFSALESQGLLPNIDKNTFDAGTARHPKWVYSHAKVDANMLAHMGLFYEYLIRRMMIDKCTVTHSGPDPLVETIQQMMEVYPSQAAEYATTLANIDNPNISWKDMVFPIFRLVALYFNRETQVPKTDVHSSFPKYSMIYNFITQVVGNIQQLYVNMELCKDSLSGHPDIFLPHCIIDIKAVQSFKTNSEECMLQVYSYAALARSMGYPINHIGILLPLQCKMLMYDITTWDSTPFLNYMCNRANHRVSYTQQLQSDVSSFQHDMYQYGIVQVLTPMGPVAGGCRCGHHIPKAGMNFKQSIMEFLNERPLQPRNSRPCQIFVANPQGGGDVSFNQMEVDEARALVMETDLKLFVHLSYLINISRMVTGPGKGRPEYIWNRLGTEIHISKMLGARGCVIHTGQPVDKPIPEALYFMEQTIKWCLPQVTEECPLLLETPAERTELCNSLEELSDFYNRFTPEEKKRLKICVDTCHVFVSGHHPGKYITTWLEKHPGSIALVHYNDSRADFGSYKDEHRMPGHGYIGYPTMQCVAAICTKYDIPMVRE